MRTLWMIALFTVLTTSLGADEKSGTASASTPQDVRPERVKVYAVGPGITAPEFIPTNLPPIAPEKCKKKVDGKVDLSLLIDTTGRPRNLMFLHPLGNDLDKFALRIVGADRFTPATSNGTPVVVAETVEVTIQSCIDEKKNDAGKKSYFLRLRSGPERKYETQSQAPESAVLTVNETSWESPSGTAPQTDHVGGSVTAPVPLNSVEAQYTDKAGRERINGKCLIALVVDRQGMPQNIRMVKTLDPGLDQNAMEAVERYRFKPAMRNGEPVPVRITVEVNFQIG
jgi:TonB family protein